MCAILLPRSCTSMKILEIYDISCLVLDQNLKTETKFLTVLNFERSKIELPHKPKIEICTHPNLPKKSRTQNPKNQVRPIAKAIVAIGGPFLDHRCCFSGVINNVFCHINFSKKHGSHFPVHLSCRMCFYNIIFTFCYFSRNLGNFISPQIQKEVQLQL